MCSLEIGLTCAMLPTITTYTKEIPETPVIEEEITIQQLILQRAKEYGVDPIKSLAIAQAENSKFDPEAKNPNSSASGVYQFLDGTFKGFCMEQYKLTSNFSQKNNPNIQIACFMRMIQDGKESHWNESKSVWERLIVELLSKQSLLP